MPSQPHSPTSKELARRRQYLRDRRRRKFYKGAWRSLIIIGLTWGLLRLATSPVWLIRSTAQLAVSNNEQLSDEAIQELVPVDYPQPLLKVKPDELAESLASHAPIAAANVSRRLLPPGLKIRVQERQPVAIALPNKDRPMRQIPDESAAFMAPGLIDADGYWMPRNSFRKLDSTASEPTLVVRGMRPGDERYWHDIYEAIAQSPVSITELDWSKSSNLVLQSDLGEVHLGPYGKGFEAQLVALDQLRSLKEKVNPEKVAFIDLRDPTQPIVEILQATGTSPSTPASF